MPVSDRFCKAVNYMGARGWVTGCGSGDFCPTLDVGRDAMAKFLLVPFNQQLYGP